MGSPGQLLGVELLAVHDVVMEMVGIGAAIAAGQAGAGPPTSMAVARLGHRAEELTADVAGSDAMGGESAANFLGGHRADAGGEGLGDQALFRDGSGMLDLEASAHGSGDHLIGREGG